MTDAERQITALVQTALLQYPGGMRAAFEAMDTERSYSTLAGDLNPNSVQGRLKVGTLIRIMELTGNKDALRYLCACFGGSFTPFGSEIPDAPTLEKEIIQDYPDVVALHRATQDFRDGKITLDKMLARLETACANLRQTAARAIQGDEA